MEVLISRRVREWRTDDGQTFRTSFKSNEGGGILIEVNSPPTRDPLRLRDIDTDTPPGSCGALITGVIIRLTSPPPPSNEPPTRLVTDAGVDDPLPSITAADACRSIPGRMGAEVVGCRWEIASMLGIVGWFRVVAWGGERRESFAGNRGGDIGVFAVGN
jgi:hypothetical protein